MAEDIEPNTTQQTNQTSPKTSIAQSLKLKHLVWGMVWCSITTAVVLFSIWLSVLVYTLIEYRSLDSFWDNITIDQHLTISFAIISAVFVEFIYRVAEMHFFKKNAFSAWDILISMILLLTLGFSCGMLGFHRYHEIAHHAKTLDASFVNNLKTVNQDYVTIDKIVSGNLNYNFVWDEKCIPFECDCLYFSSLSFYFTAAFSVFVRILITIKVLK